MRVLMKSHEEILCLYISVDVIFWMECLESGDNLFSDHEDSFKTKASFTDIK